MCLIMAFTLLFSSNVFCIDTHGCINTAFSHSPSLEDSEHHHDENEICHKNHAKDCESVVVELIATSLVIVQHILSAADLCVPPSFCFFSIELKEVQPYYSTQTAEHPPPILSHLATVIIIT